MYACILCSVCLVSRPCCWRGLRKPDPPGHDPAVRADFREEFPDHRRAEIQASLQGGKEWVLQDQRPDGSWYASWGVCFTYGAWFG